MNSPVEGERGRVFVTAELYRLANFILIDASRRWRWRGFPPAESSGRWFNASAGSSRREKRKIFQRNGDASAGRLEVKRRRILPDANGLVCFPFSATLPLLRERIQRCSIFP